MDLGRRWPEEARNAMYNLFVSGDESAWNGDPYVLERSRCVSVGEYTDGEIAARFGELNREQVAELCRLPCVFAYEKGCDQDPKFGMLQDVKGRTGQRVRIEYRLIPCDPFATAEDLESLREDLDIDRWEMNRTHWAVKDVELASELAAKDIVLPGWASVQPRRVDIRRHRFRVALSFPGEHRCYVEGVAKVVEQRLGPNTCFYDRFYPGLLARPRLDVLFGGIYGERSDLVVAFVCAEYDARCGAALSGTALGNDGRGATRTQSCTCGSARAM